MKICIDDGSTNIKMAWVENGKIKTQILPTTFKREWSLNLDEDAKTANYLIDGEKYSFDDKSADALFTTETFYQYSAVNVLAIHHALHQSGIEPQEVDIVVTLPLSEYVDGSNQRNLALIEKKKKNVLRSVEIQNGKPFTVRSVTVRPESITAGFDILAELQDGESLLIVDVGGTSSDYAHIQAKMTAITKTYYLADVGGSLITKSIQDQMAANQRLSAWQAQKIYLGHKDQALMTRVFPNESQRNNVLHAICTAEKALISRVTEAVERFSGYTHVLVVGGPAPLVAPAIKKTTGVADDHFYVSKKSQLGLVLGMLAMSGEKGTLDE